MWHQKSMVQWLKEGDNNTKFFHKMANARRLVNGIHHMVIGGMRVTNEEVMNHHVEEFFTHLYSDDRPVRPKVDGLNMPLLVEG